MNSQRTWPLSRTDFLIAILIGVAALALYIRTLAPSLLWGDSAEFQTLSYTLGMTHPSGYMTQIMVGKLFTYIPVENIAYRVNLMSAFFGALAVAETYLIVRLLGGWSVAGISASFLLTLTEGFWWRALLAESYAPAAGMLATIWLLILLWKNSGKWIYLFLAGVAGGLSIGIHSTVVMTSVSVLVFMIFTARKRTDWFAAAAGALLGVTVTFSLFLYLDHNDPPSSIYNTVYRTNLSAFGLRANQFDTPVKRFFAIFPANHFWSYYFTASSGEISRRLVEYFSSIPLWAIILVLLGALTLLREQLSEGLYPLIAFLVIWGFAITVSFSVYREFFVPVTVITSVWFGVGASKLLSLVKRFPSQNQTIFRTAQVSFMILLVALPIWHSRSDLIPALKSGYPLFVRRDHIYPVFAPDKAINDAQKILSNIEADAIVFAPWDKLYSYIYTAHIEDRKTGISFHEAWSTEEEKLADSAITYIDQNLEKRPIYFTVNMPELTQYYRVEKIDDTLYRIYRK
jgi:4-amino-4-deoxy-L-arabinose transferase and related glycosyltransferases of PMT family